MLISGFREEHTSGQRRFQIEREREVMEAAALQGVRNPVLVFSPFELFWRSVAGEMDQFAAAAYAQILDRARELGMKPMGATPVWVFPPFVKAPELNPASELNDRVPIRLPACIPQRGTAEYDRLMAARRASLERLVFEYPEVDTWVIGIEPDLTFFDCEDGQLDLPGLSLWAADILVSSSQAVRSANPKGRVLAHFLGRVGSPIRLRGNIHQPWEVMAAIEAEIQNRGGNRSLYFDEWVTVVDPTLGWDRKQEIPVPVPTGANFSSPAAQSNSAQCNDYVGCSQTVDPACRVPGWNVKCADDFPSHPSNPTTASNLASQYFNWEDVRTPDILTPIPVSSSEASLKVVPVPFGEISLAGAKTTPTQDVVPDQEWFGGTYFEFHRWVVVADLFPSLTPSAEGIHAAVFMRVNNRSWTFAGEPDPFPDQTRFGTLIWGGNITSEDGFCNNQPCAAFQFRGDDSATSGHGVQGFVNFPLAEFPFAFPTHYYRIQLIERQYGFPPYSPYHLEWRSEVWDFSESAPQLIGSSSWVSEITTLSQFGVVTPSLSGSGLMIGFGPAGQASNNAGQVDVALAGSAYWIY